MNYTKRVLQLVRQSHHIKISSYSLACIWFECLFSEKSVFLLHGSQDEGNSKQEAQARI
jgi:hypothetical protein